MTPIRNPILRKLIRFQLLAIVAGVGILALTVSITSRTNYNNEVSSLRQKVQDSLREHEEKWRTWKQLHLDDALQEELVSSKRLFPIKQIAVIPSSTLPNDPRAEEIVLPQELQGSRDDRLVLFAQLDTSHIQAAYFRSKSSIALLAGAGLLFILIILISAKYIQSSIHGPILRLNDAFDSFNKGADFKVDHIGATGEIRHFIDSVQKMYAQVKGHEEKAALAKIADQVVHDIRSPLSVLDSTVAILPSISEEKRRLLSTSISRIKGILKNIDVQNQLPLKTGLNSSTSPQLLAEQIQLIVSAKRVEYSRRRDLEIEAVIQGDEYGVFANIQPTEFDRVISNLINNSVEAVEGSGRITVTLATKKQNIILKISDSGKGINPGDLPRLMSRGVTIGRANGKGLGLYHAKTTVESWGGKIQIESAVGVGTTVMIELMRAAAPSWFADALYLNKKDITIVVFDDDASIHEIWKSRFRASNLPVKLLHFFEPEGLRKWHRENPAIAADALFLNDYEIRDAVENGLDMVEELRTEGRTILVTSRFEDEAIRVRCDKLTVKLIPKNFAGFIPIRANSSLVDFSMHAQTERGLV